MLDHAPAPATPPAPTNELTLSDHLITLAEAAARAGFTKTARHLVSLACSVFDETAQTAH